MYARLRPTIAAASGVGTDLGAAHYDGIRWSKLPTAEGLPRQKVQAIAVQHLPGGDVVWFGTDAGAASWDGAGIHKYTTADGLASYGVLGIAIDSDSNVWFASHDRSAAGVSRFDGTAWLGQGLGLSYHTVEVYLDNLVGAFLIRRLEPYQPNITKRLIKRPKVYWRDTGLVHALLNVPDRHTLLAQPWVGASWEGFVIEQVIGDLASIGRSFNAYYFRTSDQHELDLVLDFGGELWAVEVKLTAAPGSDDMKRLEKAADMIGASRRFLVSQTRHATGDDRRASLDLASFLQLLRG